MSEDAEFVFGSFDILDRASVAVFAAAVDLDDPSAPLLHGFHVGVDCFSDDAFCECAGLCSGQFVVGRCHLVCQFGVGALRPATGNTLGNAR